jgi:serine/threonine protein kinase
MEPIEFGRYRLIRQIAQGGMAQIFLAVQRGPHGFEKVAVLKVILPDLCANDDFVQMFLDEARIAANLDHNNVVRVYDFGEIGGRYYIAMEHLPGEDLASILQASRRAKRHLPIEVAVDFIIGAATGLHFAHELKDSSGKPMNVVHRDVSPSNVLVTYHGTVKLVDFGIARAESNITKTEAGTLKGKVAYVSPEQAMGEPIDRRSDIFALGTVLSELLTTVRLFKRESDLATLQAVASGPINPPSLVRPESPPALDEIVLKAMARNPAQRYATAADLADALTGFLMTQGYARSERKLADFMTSIFDVERRDAKLLISQAAAVDGGPVLKTPSQLRHLPTHLSPLRSQSTLTSMPSVAVPQPQPEPQQSRTLLYAGLVGLALVAMIATFFALKAPPAPQVVTVVELPVPKADPRAPEPAPPPEVKVPDPVPPLVAPTVAAVAVADPKPKAKPAAKARGLLTLDTSPYTEVFLNGKRLGDTPLVNFPMPAGIQVLQLVNEDKKIRRSIEVVIEPGKTIVKKLKL